MKKLVLIAAVGMFAISCGTKESSTSMSNSDSAAVDNTATMAPATTDTMTTAPTTTGNPDSMKMKMDTAATAR
ncbi:cytochrome C551 [Chryseobacterium sp. SN22]|uniref:cytochrome C551 n=1 Tax=Chryseobacterium sp. SN22 TaxID=2606431 RepID=UPI0011ED1C64|nr:cytochrome C551 [Chryseobacterium sp. SN22]KAA0129282.1 cytochrome C551 [Chryseobacterium sp. SN22]